MNRQIIVTGGLGYIGSHTIVELKNYFDVFIVIDDLSNSNSSVICQLEKLTGKKVVHFSSTVNDDEKLKNIFADLLEVSSVFWCYQNKRNKDCLIDAFTAG